MIKYVKHDIKSIAGIAIIQIIYSESIKNLL